MILRAVFSVTALFALIATAPLAMAERVSPGTGAELRVLDKLSGALTTVEIANGGEKIVGRIAITMTECRYPSGNAAGNAYAHLTIRNANGTALEPLFDGWMIASSPALSALDHPRYDVWVLRCITS